MAAVTVTAPLWIPVCLGLGFLVWAEDRKSPVFRQKRVGLRGETFEVLKFRTMRPDAEDILRRQLAERPEVRAEWETSFKLRNDPRVTAVGRVLRRTSLDELPQLLNVVRGEMSLVGPRPISAPHHRQFSREAQRLRVQVRPGMTGLWQVSGREDSSMAGMEPWDVQYVRRWSLRLDLTILLRTWTAVVRGSGAY